MRGILQRALPPLVAAAVFGIAWGATQSGGQSGDPAAKESSVYTPAHRTFWEALSDFLGRRPAPVQPIAFTHRVHVANRIGCTAYCHTGADKGPVARIPGVKTCMICHSMVAIEKPEIKRVTAYAERGEEIPWQRVYGFTAQAHVRFNHAPHIRAGVDCATCHGNVKEQTVAVRSVNLTMGYCVDCHKQRSAPVECATCHF